jgi:catechol 2,3-dioxygenase-like lactoylglutathione lyase family enzyme
MFRYIHSVGVVVDDIDAAVTFYVDTLGFEKRIDNVVDGGYRFVTVSPAGGQTEIGFNLRDDSNDVRTPAIAFIVDDVDAICDMLRAKNVEIIHGPVDEEWGGRGAYFKDPFGNELYITTG